MPGNLKWTVSSKNNSWTYFNMKYLGCQWALLIYMKVVTVLIPTEANGYINTIEANGPINEGGSSSSLLLVFPDCHLP